MLATFQRILQFWRPHAALGFGLIVTMMLRAVFSVTLALTVKFVIDQVVEPSDGASMWIVALVMTGFTVSLAAGLIAARLTAKATAEIVADVRTQTFEHLQLLPMSFYHGAATGDLMAIFSSDIAQLSRGVIRKPLVGLRAITAMALFIPVMFLLDTGLAIAAVVAIPLIVYAVYRFAPPSASVLDTEKQLIANVLNEVDRNVAAQMTVRAYGLSDRSRHRFGNRVSALRAMSQKAEGRIALETVISEYAVEMAKLIIILAGAVLTFAGSLDPGSFAAFVAILTEFTYQASVLGMDVIPSIKQSEAGIRRIDSLLATEPHRVGPRTHPAPDMGKTITFDDVVLRYGATEKSQLSGISLEIPTQSYVAIVGPNGSGKSSLFNVLLGLYGLDSGSISVDGVDLATVSMEDVRDDVGIAFQDTYLFDGTIRDNVTLGVETCDEGELRATLEAAGLGSIVDGLDGGVDTVIGANGIEMSAGEAQRIGIARALMRNPNLLLLDEITSGLDPASEADIQNAIEALRSGRSIVSVTHRLETVKASDLIVVVDDGTVVESGSFEALLSTDGMFRTMWTKQHGFEISANGLSARVKPERLLDIPLFSDLDVATVQSLAAIFDSQYVGQGELVFKEGERGDSFYVIARGVVEVVLEIHTAQEHVIAYLSDGDFFGEMALLSSERRNASIRVRDAATLLRLDQRSFTQLLDGSPAAREKVEMVASQREHDNESSFTQHDSDVL